MSDSVRRVLSRVLFVAAGIAALLSISAPASAHGILSVVYANLESGGTGVVRAELQLEYDLLVVSAADAEKDDPLYRTGMAAFQGGDATEQAAVLIAHRDTIAHYVTERFRITAPERRAPHAWTTTSR